MTTNYSDIQPLREAGMTNAEIAASLLGRRWTVRAISVAALIDWLRENRIARFAADGAWKGVLVDLLSNDQVSAQLKDAIEELLSHLRNSKAEILSTHEGQRGALLHVIAAAGGLSNEQRTSLYALGGGERFADATEDAVAILSKGEQARIAAARLINAKAFFAERMTADGDAAAIWSHAWTDAGEQ